MTSPPERRRRSVIAMAEWAALVALSYVPFLLSSPGRLASDSKQALYVDPRGFLADAAFLWDPGVGAGTVPHQHLGYLWPMGPWFWFFDTIGVPDWIAQRLWLGTLTFGAALGARWLVRSLGFGRGAALTAALVYAMTPYQLAFTARTSVLLLPWVGLPYLVELTRRAVARGGWRHPAAFALVTFTAAGVNAATLLLLGTAPLLVLLATAIRGRPRPALGAALRIGALTVPACAWWMAGLRVQAGYGIDVLALTESLETVSSRSSPDDVLRGLGNWFFYGGDRVGPAVDQARYYETSTPVVVASFLVPMLALAAGAAVRWRGRAVAVAMIATAVVAVGAWPYDDPSPFGRAFRWFAEQSSAGLAFRNSPRIVPVLVLGMAVVLAAALAAAPDRLRRPALAVVCLAALAGLAPVAREGMLSDPVERPGELPAYWVDAAAHLDASGDGTRVLELPGANFAAYRWGNSIEPVTPLLIDRGFLAREVLPAGTAESILLLDALDRRLQNGVLDPASVAPVARLLGVGDVVVRSDLAYERFDLPRPPTVWATLVDPRAPGLGDPTTFGTPVTTVVGGALDPLVPSDLDPAAPDRGEALPPVAVLPVDDPQTIVRVASGQGTIVLDGDGDGIVDAAAAGIVDGRTLVLGAPGLDDEQLAQALDGGAHLVVTDSNRRRIQTWFNSLRDTRGPTERAGETILEPSGDDARLPSYPDSTDDERTIVEQLGATVTATSGGGAARPEDRAAAALDGRLGTSWRVGGADPTGNHLVVRLEAPRLIDRITFVQPQDGPRDRTLTAVRVTVGDAPPVEVRLDETSLTPDGQEIAVPATTADRVDIELVATSTPPFDPALANAVGFAEVRIGDLVVAETVRMPLDLLDRAGERSAGLPLDLVMTRLRTSPDRWQRGDDEHRLDRTFDLPTQRWFTISGTARLDDDAPDHLLDEILGTSGATTVDASSRLQGVPAARASRAVDGDPSTAWTAAFGSGAGSWIELRADGPTAVDDLTLSWVADGQHSLPRRVTVLADDEVVSTNDIAAVAEGGVGTTAGVTIPLEDGLRAERLRIVVDEIEPRRAAGADPGEPPLPVALAEITGTGFAAVPTSGTVDDRCRTDLLALDGEPVDVRVEALLADGALGLVGCDRVAVDAGTHRTVAAEGDGTGLDLDQLTWRSSSDDTDARQDDTPIDPIDPVEPGARVGRLDVGRTSVTADIDTDGNPFWFVLGQSSNAGWEIEVDGASAGSRTVVDGYADGWYLTPDGSGPVQVRLRWAPQRTVVVGMVVSAIAVVVCLVVLLRTPRSPKPDHLPRPQLLPRSPSVVAGSWAQAATAGALTAVAVALVSRPWIGVLSGLLAVAVARRPAAAWLAAALAPAALAAARPLDRPELGWLALGILLAAVIPDVLRTRDRPTASP